MENNKSEIAYEQKRLEQTISLAKKQLSQAKLLNEENKLAIISAKKELRENTSHSISNLWNSEEFEALAELNQYVNPVTDKIADYEEIENTIAQLEKIIKNPYFARINFKFEGEDHFEPIYIGRSSLKKDNSYELDVYDWRSPIASVFYRFVTGATFYDAPGGRITGEVNLKRQYEIHDGVLDYYFDADVQIVDEFLRKLLSENTSSKMKTIVETIQKEQDIVIRDMKNDLMMVQGVAGSGKTSIALHRVAYLMYQGLSGKLSANNIIIISPNLLFEQYISHVLPELGERNVVSIIFEDILTTILQQEQIQSRNQFLEDLLISPTYHNVIKNSIEFKTSHEFRKIMDIFISDLPHSFLALEDIYYEGQCILKKDVLKEKIAGRAETPIGIKLKQLEEFIIESINVSRKRRISKSEENLILKEVRRFTQIHVIDLYKKLFLDIEYFHKLTNSLPYSNSIKDIFEFTKGNLTAGHIFYDDAIVLTYLTLKIYGFNDYKNIKQIVIDEAQDYYPLQFEIFKLLFPNSKFTILGDMNQTIDKQEDLSLYEQIKRILNKKRASLVTMDKSFRCTNEILKFSLKFLERSPEIKSFNREGAKPEIYIATNQLSLNDKILSEVKFCQESGYQSIGLICKSEKNSAALYKCLKDKMDIQFIKGESISDLHGVFLIPVYLSKGLEFDAVLVCDTDATNYNTENDKNLLYIACTRALHRLNIFCIGKRSPFL